MTNYLEAVVDRAFDGVFLVVEFWPLALIALIGLGLIATPYLCVDSEGTQHALVQQGYTNVAPKGHGWFACGEGDFYSTRFSAINPSGNNVSGVVCSGLLFKAATIRFDLEPRT